MPAIKVTLLSRFVSTSVILPERCAGQYWVRAANQQGKLVNVIAIEAIQGPEPDAPAQWNLVSNRRFRAFASYDDKRTSIPLELRTLYQVDSADKKNSYALYSEPLSDDRKRYSACKITRNSAVLTIGRNEGCQVIYKSNYVSDRHAQLSVSNGKVSLRDLGSTNHTYVNGKAVAEAELKTGDIISIFGLQIIVTGQFLFLNNPDGRVTIHSDAIEEYHVPVSTPPHSDDFEDGDTELNTAIAEDEAGGYYYRAPRFKQDADVFELKLDSPPGNQNKEEMPMAMVLGPSMTMGLAAMTTGTFSVINAMGRNDITSAIPSLVMSVSMLMGTMLWPTITRTYQRRLNRAKEERRQAAYNRYLEQMERLIAEETARQEDILRKNDVDLDTCVQRITGSVPQIWERTRKHSDFLSLRLGSGSLPLRANIRCPERRFTVEDDSLTELAYQFGERDRLLTDVPVCLQLDKHYVSGVYAPRERLLAYAKELIVRLITLHAYDEVKIALICDVRDADEFSFLRWLPFSMDRKMGARYLATTSDQAKVLSAVMDKTIEYRKALSQEQMLDEKPYYVIICLDKELALKTECVRRILEYKSNLRFSVLSFFERLEDLPKECSAVVELKNADEGNLTIIHDVSDAPIPFWLDKSQSVDLRSITRVLANLEVDSLDSSYTLPSKFTFFEMLGLGMAEHLNLLERWSSNDPTKSLAAPIGVDKYGEPFKLDLHERAHGPHGLVAGMTGSGKSELIISYILSMAVSYHPYEVAFILIDYKGGGMAKPFEKLPHTAGVITNLDGNSIQRALASLNSEIHRRERIFQEASERYHISNIDIYKYQKLYRDKRVSDPLPHLFVISDEFAELKKDQPEFMAELTSAARVGRSLGVHLILATQKPAGVVDDQIRSNSRFRICLKVQDAGDSGEMLGRPEAAALTEAGRFYLQVGYNEVFELGQSAWSGAPYYPSPRVIKERDDAVSVIDANGRVIAEANTERFPNIKEPRKQLDVIVEHIRSVAQKDGIAQWKMWLDPIPAAIYIDELEKKYPETGKQHQPFILNPVIGEADDPAHQLQTVLSLPLSSEGNALVYGSAGSGKAMFLEAMCYSLLKNHAPGEVNLYILDFGAETLTAFAPAPHVGDVILAGDTERVNRLFTMLLKTLGKRKKLLSEYGGNLIHYNAQAAEPEANIVVVINNYAAFSELFDEKSAEMLLLAREGTKYGIYFVLTCTGVNSVRLNLRQNFKQVYCLRLNQDEDYSSVVGKTNGVYPEPYAGRGIYRRSKDEVLEFQSAMLTDSGVSTQFIQSFARGLSGKHAGRKAAAVPVLPASVTRELLAPYVREKDLSSVPVAICKDTLNPEYWDFTASPVNLVLAQNREWQSFGRALVSMLTECYGVETWVFAPAEAPGGGAVRASRLFQTAGECSGGAKEIYNLILRRFQENKECISHGDQPPKFAQVFVLIESVSALKAMLESVPAQDQEPAPINYIQVALEKCESAYQVCFLVEEGAGTLTPFTAEGWYRTHIRGNTGFWVGAGFNSQYRFNITQRPTPAQEETQKDSGYLVRDRVISNVKFLHEQEDAQNEEIPC